MASKTMQNIGTPKAYRGQKGYTGECVFITDDLECIFSCGNNMKTDITLFIYCHAGQVSLCMGNASYTLHTGDLFVSYLNATIGDVVASDDLRVRVIGFSSNFVHRLASTNIKTWQGIKFLRTHPIKHLDEKNITTINHYISLIGEKMGKNIDTYQKSILLHIASALFEEIMSQILTDADFAASIVSEDNDTQRPDHILMAFIEAVIADRGRHRSVAYFADKLCLTSKYLSQVVKNASGRNALSIINDKAINNIIAELRGTTKDIKQIAYDFDFPSNTFFSKYFHNHVGMTPSEFRYKQPDVPQTIR